MIENCKRLFVEAPALIDYQEFGDPNAEKIHILLHGFGQNSDIILEDLKDILDPKSYWLIPNGVFPMPKKRAEGISYKFAWYFYNTVKEEYYIDFTYPCGVLKAFINQVDPKRRPLTIIGYSQGGYLAPFLGQAIEQTEKVLGINCNFRHDMLEEEVDFELYQIHGSIDPIVDYENSKNSFELLKPRLKRDSRHITIDKGTHSLGPDFIDEIKKLI
ncbi:serine hydrolase [Bacteriovorax sp. DB6_IX]|uniref:serine hydrolase n=1 Tax=Bacteriovorax sp. DB6_IX TaxID=1353530 RepID=UPI000389EEEC|nr:serine hydrolase [Bacteriovorax sp. DB6_IX]EQC51677.1 serine hydrolase [Bacteriovorax sp. DB6_IX]